MARSTVRRAAQLRQGCTATRSTPWRPAINQIIYNYLIGKSARLRRHFRTLLSAVWYTELQSATGR